MIEFMNFDSTTFPNFGSGLISRFSALWRRDIDRSLASVNSLSAQTPSRPLPCFYNCVLATVFSRYSARAPSSLRPLGTVFRTPLLAVLHPLCVEHTAQDVITNARKVLH